VGRGPEFCRFLDGPFAGKPKDAARPSAPAVGFVGVEGDKVKMRIVPVVAARVVYCKDETGLPGSEAFGVGACECRSLIRRRFQWKRDDEPFRCSSFLADRAGFGGIRGFNIRTKNPLPHDNAGRTRARDIAQVSECLPPSRCASGLLNFLGKALDRMSE